MDESRGTAESNEVTQTQTDQFRISTGRTFSPEEWNTINQPVIDQFRANAGTVVERPSKDVPILLLTTIGARTGRTLVSTPAIPATETGMSYSPPSSARRRIPPGITTLWPTRS